MAAPPVPAAAAKDAPAALTGRSVASDTATTAAPPPMVMATRAASAVSAAEELKTVSPAPVPTFTAVKAAGPVPTTVAAIVRHTQQLQQQSSAAAPPGPVPSAKPAAVAGDKPSASAVPSGLAPTGSAVGAPQTGGGRGTAPNGTRSGGTASRGGRGQPVFLSGRAGSPYHSNAVPPTSAAGGGASASVFHADSYGATAGGGGFRGRGGGGYRSRRYSMDAGQSEGAGAMGDGDGRSNRYRHRKQLSGNPGGGAEAEEDDRDAFNRDNYKTEICRTHLQHGFCEYEDNCQFAHGVNELRPRHFGAKYKTQLCKNYHNDGACRFGSRCKFIHDEHRVRVSDKEFWLISPSENLVRVEMVDNPQRQAELAALVVSQDRMAQVLGPGGQALAAAAAANTTASAAATMMPVPVRAPAIGAAQPLPQPLLHPVSIGADAEDAAEQQPHAHHVQGGASTPASASGLVTPSSAPVTPLVLPAPALLHAGGGGMPAQVSPAMHIAPQMPDLNLASLQHSGAVMFGDPPTASAAAAAMAGGQGLVPLMPPRAVSAAGVPVAAMPYRPATQMGVYYVPAPAAIAAGANPMPQPLPMMFYAPPPPPPPPPSQPQPMTSPAAATGVAPPTHRIQLPPLPLHIPPPLMAGSGSGYSTPISPATVTTGSGASSVSNSPAHAHVHAAAHLQAHMQYLSLSAPAPPHGAGHSV